MPDANLLTSASLKAADLFGLSGRRALVTGGSRGIAATIAEALAANGAEVGINYSDGADRASDHPGAADALAGRIRKAGGRAATLPRDLSSPEAASDLVADMEATLGPADILVISASMQIHKPLDEMTLDEARQQIDLNLLSTVALLKAALPGMTGRGYGRVLVIGSVQEDAPSGEMPIYAATKAAQLNLVRNLAVEVAGKGVTINTLSPGLIATDRNAFRRRDPAAWDRAQRAANPMGRAGTPQDMAGAALLLCSDAAAFITGARLLATGGGHLNHTEPAGAP